MNDKAKKILKIVLWTVGIIVLVPIVLVLTLPLWLGPIFRPSLNAIAPTITKTAFHVDRLHLNPYTCNFELGGVTIGNPEGFSDPVLAKLGYFNVDVDADTVFDKVIVVDNVEISDIYITWLTDESGKNNLDTLQENLLGAENEFEKELEKERKLEEERMRREGMSEAEIKAEEEASKINRKIIVNRFVFKNVSGKFSVPKLGVIPFKVPYNIELKNLGRDSGGYDLDNLRDAVMKEFWASVMSSSSNFSGLVGEQAGKAMDALKDYSNKLKLSTDSIKKAGDQLKNAGDQLKNVGDSLMNIFK